MLCDRCQVNQASLHFEKTMNGQTVKAELCAACAQFLGLTVSGVNHPPRAVQARGARGARCPECGLDFVRFQKTLLFGCPACYQAFAPRLDAVFKRVQPSLRHVGRKPGAGPAARESESGGPAFELEAELLNLRELQQEAVACEDYEKAARLRDRIKALQAGEAKVRKEAGDDGQ